MSQMTTTEQTAIKPSNSGFDLSPQTFDQAMQFSQMLAESDFVPKDFKGKPGNCLIAMQWGAEIGLKPLQALQNLAVINARPALWGDSVIALVRSSPLCEYVTESDDGHTATCKVKRRGEAEQVRMFSMDDAKAAGLLGKQGPWTQYPKRMRQMRARAFALRDVFPDVLRGMPVAEEVMDIPRDMGAASVVPGPEQHDAQGPSAELVQQAEQAATKGAAAYQAFWKDAGKDKRKLLAGEHERLKAMAAAADAARTVDAHAPTADALMQRLEAAQTLDQLMDAADLIGEVADPAQREALAQRYTALAEKFGG